MNWAICDWTFVPFSTSMKKRTDISAPPCFCGVTVKFWKATFAADHGHKLPGLRTCSMPKIVFDCLDCLEFPYFAVVTPAFRTMIWCTHHSSILSAHSLFCQCDYNMLKHNSYDLIYVIKHLCHSFRRALWNRSSSLRGMLPWSFSRHLIQLIVNQVGQNTNFQP